MGRRSPRRTMRGSPRATCPLACRRGLEMMRGDAARVPNTFTACLAPHRMMPTRSFGLHHRSNPMSLGTLNALGGARYAPEGRIVTMDAADRVLDGGTLYIDGGRIEAVLPTGSPPPTGFEDVTLLKTGGTIYPGLIEFHNHLSYNVLQLWDAHQKYTNRDQWGGTPVYRQLISGPMTVLGKTPGYVEAVVRYVECKCLLGGVTTSQGIALFSNA